MDKATKESFHDTSPQTVRELTSPLSPKRRRTDWANSCTETFHKTVCCTSSAGTFQMTADLVRTVKCGVIGDEEPDGTAMIVGLIANLSASHTREAPTSSPEGCPLPLLTDEQPLVAEFVELCHHLQDDAGGKFAESHTSPESSTDAWNHSDCKLQRESLEVGPPSGCSLSTQKSHEGRPVVSSVSEVQSSNYSWDTWRPAECEKSVQKQDGHIFREMLPSSEREEAEVSYVSSSHSDNDLFDANIEDILSVKWAEDAKNEGDGLELQIRGNRDISACETKGSAEDNGLSRNTIHCAAQCAKGSIVPYDVVSAGKIATERGGLEADVLCEAGGEHAAGKMIAEAGTKTADHPAEPPAHARGDNDAGCFNVIDPAVCRETDRESAGTRCYSERSAVADFLPSVKVCDMETPPALGFDVTPWLWSHRGQTQEWKDEKDNLCQPHAAPLAWPNSPDRKQDSPCCSSERSPAEDEGQESLQETAERLLKNQAQAVCFPVSSGDLKTQEDAARLEPFCEDGETQVNVTATLSSEEPGEEENPTNVDQKLEHFGQRNDASVHASQGRSAQWVFDHMYSAARPLMEETTDIGGGSNVKAELNSQTSPVPDGVHLPERPNSATEKAQDHRVGRKSDITSELLRVGRPEQESRRIYFFDCRLSEETVTVHHVTPGDAVVPSELNTSDDPAALNSTNQSSPPSVEFNSFQSVRLLQDECSHSPRDGRLLTSSTGGAEAASAQEVILEGGETSGVLRSDSCHDEDPDTTKPGAAAPHQLASRAACSVSGSGCSPVDVQDDSDLQTTGSSRPSSGSDLLLKFEMKKQFDSVLSELHLYFAISLSDFPNDEHEESCWKDVTEAPEGKTSDCCNEELSGGELKSQKDILLGN